MKRKDLPPGRVLPPNFKHLMEVTFHRRFTWKERMKIALGYAIQVDMIVRTEHHTGKFSPAMTVTTTPEIPQQLP